MIRFRDRSPSTEYLSMDLTSTQSFGCISTLMVHRCLRPIRINICDSTYLPAFVIVSAVASSLFVSYDLPFKLERSCASGHGAQTASTRPQESDSKCFHTPPTVSKTPILVTLGCLTGYVCISEFSSCFASTFAAEELRNNRFVPSLSP